VSRRYVYLMSLPVLILLTGFLLFFGGWLRQALFTDDTVPSVGAIVPPGKQNPQGAIPSSPENTKQSRPEASGEHMTSVTNPDVPVENIGQTVPPDDVAPDEPEPPPVKQFPRERLVYSVTSWLGRSGGITMEIGPLSKTPEGRPFYEMQLTLETNQVTSAIYVMKGTVAVAFDAVSLLPLIYEQNIRSGLGITGGSVRRKKLQFDHQNRLLKYWKAKGSKDELKYQRQRVFPEGAHHFLTLLIALRHTELKAGDTMKYVTLDRKRDIEVTGSVLREEHYRDLKGQRQTALVLETRTDFGKEEMEQGVFLIWVDKASHIPVQLEVEIPLGTMTAKLERRIEIAEPVPEPR
jgi:hypothetical protein